MAGVGDPADPTTGLRGGEEGERGCSARAIAAPGCNRGSESMTSWRPVPERYRRPRASGGPLTWAKAGLRRGLEEAFMSCRM